MSFKDPTNDRLNISTFAAIEAQVRELQNKRKHLNRTDVPKENERVGLGDVGGYDDDIYTGTKSKFEGYHTSLALDEADVSFKRKTFNNQIDLLTSFSKFCVTLAWCRQALNVLWAAHAKSVSPLKMFSRRDVCQNI